MSFQGPNLRLSRSAKEADFPGMRRALADGADDLDSPLVEAAALGLAMVVEWLLDWGADPNFETPDLNSPRTALGRAAANGHLETAALLVERGATVAPDANAALRKIAGAGNIAFARLLLDAGALPDVGVVDTPLLRATAAGEVDMVRLLIERGANFRAYADAPLACAIRHERRDAAQLLLSLGASAPDAWRQLWNDRQRLYVQALDLPPDQRARIESFQDWPEPLARAVFGKEA